MLNKSLVLLLFLSEIIISIKANDISVQIKNGKLNGKKETVDGKDVNVFLGIPYAEPPIGDLRFKKPLPVKQWSQPIDAYNWPNPCLQNELWLQFFHNKNYSEDCLYLNIWSPLISGSSDNLKPVMFWIHGGALLWGSSNEQYYSGEVLSTKGDVVVVTINYRLNTFGFLYTGTDEAPGNMGFWDQTLALEWVNDNIKYFGGDPNQITIFGQSAGGWSTSLHILSPISRNLYRNAIVISGSPINKIFSDDPESAVKNWLKGAKLIGCTDDENNSEDQFTPKIIDCLRNSDPEKLISIPYLPQISHGLIGLLPHVVADGQFLPKKPLDMLRDGDYKKNLNLLIGSAEDEGSFLLALDVDPVKYHLISPHNLTYREAYNELVRISSGLKSEIPFNGEHAAKFYFTGLSDNNNFDLLRRTIGIAVGDFMFSCPTIQFAKILFSNDREKSNVYQYYYNSKLGEEKFVCSKWMGACHGNDIWPIFGIPFRLFDKHLDREREISHQMIDLFTHFAKTGRPSPQNGANWPKYYYTINDNIITPYYEITSEPKPNTNFGNGLKSSECDYLWKTFIDQQ